MRRLRAVGLGRQLGHWLVAAASPRLRPVRRIAHRVALAFAMGALFGVSGCHAQRPEWPLWDAYANRFLDQQGRVIDHNAGDRTTTEGEAYAMFFALVANDQPRFDKLVEWTENNMAQGDLTLHLPAWSWGKAPDGSWKVLDPNPAADADLWMAYALCEAGRLWKVERYTKLGRLMAGRVAHEEVVTIPGVGITILPGAQGFHPDPNTWYLNPSYLPPSLIAYFAKVQPLAPWRQVLDSLPALVRTPGGYAMDWVKVSATGVEASATPAADQEANAKNGPGAPPRGSYDAIRVYLWLGLADPKTPGVKQTLAALPGMALWLNSHPAPPEVIDEQGRMLQPNAPVGFSAAVIPYLHAMNLKPLEQGQADRLEAMHDAKSGLYGKDIWYYDQNLALFATGWNEHRYRFHEDGRLSVKWK